MPGYDQPCRYCDEFISPDARVCPVCGKNNPVGPLRCPRCRNPIQEKWKRCNHCGRVLETTCPHCSAKTFFGDYCEHCAAALLVTCPHAKCRAEQPPLGETCVKCGKPMR